MFDVRRGFLARSFFGSSIFDQKYYIFLSQVGYPTVFIFEIHGCKFLQGPAGGNKNLKICVSCLA